MIRKFQFLFRDNEHGSGDVSFPNLIEESGEKIEQAVIQGNTVGSLRRAAKEQGWGRVDGADYCPLCMESMG